jgi:hypothetical protein
MPAKGPKEVRTESRIAWHMHAAVTDGKCYRFEHSLSASEHDDTYCRSERRSELGTERQSACSNIAYDEHSSYHSNIQVAYLTIPP